MRRLRLSVLAGACLLASRGIAEPVAAETVRLCGYTAGSQAALYFEVAKAFDAEIVRADTGSTLINVPSAGLVWNFVTIPVQAVLCRRADNPIRLGSVCQGPTEQCHRIVAKLTADPRAAP